MSPTRRTRCALAALGALALAPRAAHATGMQGHMYMALCAAEQVSDPRLASLFESEELSLANGAFLVDSGYIAEDHDQGEIPHWEGFIEAYVQVLRERYPAPLDDPEGAKATAVLMGMAAHGITDSTFDSLFMARAGEVEPAPLDSFDTSMDVFLVADMPRYFIPELAYPAELLSEVFTRVEHPVSAEAIDSAASTARSGIAAVTLLLYTSAGAYGEKYPWGRAHMLDPRTPGAYPFGASVVTGYYRELLKRLDGDTSAEGILIGTYPNTVLPLTTLRASRADAAVVLYFGTGLDRSSLEGAVSVRSADGADVPVTVEVFRGDTWANVLTVKPTDDWQPGTTYDVTLHKTVKTLHGTSPSGDQTLSFTTCASPDAAGDCPVAAERPPSLCPKTEARHAARPGEGEGGGAAATPGATGAPPAGGCHAAAPDAAPLAGVLGAAGLAAALAARSARRRR